MGDKNVVKCRTCNGDHWTSKCPWKDTMLAGGKAPDDKNKAPSVGPSGKYSFSHYISNLINVFNMLIAIPCIQTLFYQGYKKFPLPLELIDLN